MYSLYLSCSPDEVDRLSGELWELGTAGIREIDAGDDVQLIAGFEDNTWRARMLLQFAAYTPEWRHEKATDWVEQTRAAWPARLVGQRLFLAPHWSSEETPAGRVRLIHNPGLACGTGEHPCTQLALAALETCILPGALVADIGSGSGILAIAALLLGAGRAVGVDVDEAALHAARENFALNTLPAALVAGSADCLGTGIADVVVANISASVLLSILSDLVRIAKTGARLILTGFPEWELAPLLEMFPGAHVTSVNEWRCLIHLAAGSVSKANSKYSSSFRLPASRRPFR